MQVPTLRQDNNEKSNSSGLLLNMIWGVLSLGFLLALPSGILGWFDGLPWAGKIETLVLSVIIPFLLILRWRFLSFRFSAVFLCVLLLIKVSLFFGSPPGGLLVKIHPNLSNRNLEALWPFKLVDGESWAKTYATSWNKKASAVYTSPWKQKMDFPLDWFIRTNRGCVNTSNVRQDCLEVLSVIVEIEGVLVISKGEKFAFIGKGIQEGTLTATNELGNSFVLNPAENLKDVAQPQYHLPGDGRWKISGKFKYAGSDWSLMLVLVGNDGHATTDLGRDVLWQNNDALSSSLMHIGFYKFLSLIVDGGVVMFLLFWIFSTINYMTLRQVLNWPLFIFCISAVCIPYVMAPFLANVLKLVGLSDPTTLSYLGVSINISGIGFLLWMLWQKNHTNFHADRIMPSIFLLFGPAVLFYFSNKWWFSIGKWNDWGAGNDWVTYQDFARKIVVEGEWLTGGEGVYVAQALYRYFVGLYHLLFGQSAYVQNLADVWCILGATILIAGFSIKFRISPVVTFITCIAFLSINFIGSYRYLIGKGLQEFHAMILMFLAAWFLYRAREGNVVRLVLATLFGILGYWTRQDHLGAIAGLAFLMLEPVDGPTGGWKGYWDRLQFHWQKILVYWGLGISSVLLLCFRNWWLGGVFFPSGNFGNWSGTYETGQYYLILTGNLWPHFPSISGFAVTLGVFVALLALIWRPKLILNFPLSLGVIFAGLLAPYAVLYSGGYAPRFSIHILPLALLSLVFCLNHLPWIKHFKPQIK